MDEKKTLMSQLTQAQIDSNLEKAKTIYKFHFFFPALVFAILSFSIQFPVHTNQISIKLVEILSWITLAVTGLLGLKQIGGFSLDDTEKYHTGLSKAKRLLMWILFTAGVILLLIAKICESLTGYM